MDRQLAQGLTQALARKGRRGDTQIAHVAKGEFHIPKRVLNENPTLYAGLAKAFQKSGLDFMDFVSGKGTAKVNPETGAEEFYDAADYGDAGGAWGGYSDPGSVDANGGAPDYSDGSRNDAQGTPGPSSEARGGPEGDAPNNGGGANDSGVTISHTKSTEIPESDIPDKPLPGGTTVTPGQQQGPTQGVTITNGDLVGAGFSLFGALTGAGPVGSLAGRGAQMAMGEWGDRPAFSFGGGPLSGSGRGQAADDSGDPMAFDGGEYLWGGKPQVYEAAKQTFGKPGEMGAPDFLGLNPAMTDLQRRSAIATFGSQGEDSTYRDSRVRDYYYNLLRRALVNDQGGVNDYSSTVLPVEERYLRETLGVNYQPQSEALLNAIASS